jgi:hypothetical protein
MSTKYHFSGLLYVVVLSLACLSPVACGGSNAKYAPATHPWIGKCATFAEPMVYMTNLPTDFSRDEVVRIGRVLMSSSYAEYLRGTPKAEGTIVTPVPQGSKFEVVAVFTIVYEGYSRMLVDDVEMAVLKDNGGQKSTIVLDGLEPCSGAPS